MTARSATHVLVIAGDGTETRSCLDALRPTLGLRDRVTVIVPASDTRLLAALRWYGWAHVATTAPEEHPFDHARQIVVAGDEDVAVILDSGTLVTGRWLDGLLAAFRHADVGAAAPVSNLGRDEVESAAGMPDTLPRLRTFERAWERSHRGQLEDRDELQRGCLAIRRSALDGAPGAGPEDRHPSDLCHGLGDGGWRLVLSRASVVLQKRSMSGAGAVHVSACLITRDESDNLPACLASLHGKVDEIVVYDTGSTDDTVEVARAAGATVVTGYWDDDFARARNAAVQHCGGEWVLSIDADEVVLDGSGLRQEVAGAVDVDCFVVDITNLADGGGAGVQHRAPRLFRRSRGRWSGRLHEEIVARDGQPLRTAHLGSLRIEHSGYLSAAVRSRAKGERNLRIAAVQLSEAVGREERAGRLVDLARALSAAGDRQAAIERCTEAKDEATTPFNRRRALQYGAQLLLAAGRTGDARAWIDELRTLSERTESVDYLRDVALVLDGAPAREHACLSPVGELWDDEGLTAISTDVLRTRAADLLVSAGRRDDAADVLLALALDDPGALRWVPAVRSWSAAGRDLATVVAAIPEDRLRPVLAQLSKLEGKVAGELAEHLWARFEGDERVLAFAALVGSSLDEGPALEWAARLRARGLVERCPLVAKAADPRRTHAERLRAAAIALGTFDDDRAQRLLLDLAPLLPETSLAAALEQLGTLAPQALPAFIERSATTPSRAEALASALLDLGAPEEAAVLSAHAASLLG